MTADWGDSESFRSNGKHQLWKLLIIGWTRKTEENGSQFAKLLFFSVLLASTQLLQVSVGETKKMWNFGWSNLDAQRLRNNWLRAGHPGRCSNLGENVPETMIVPCKTPFEGWLADSAYQNGILEETKRTSWVDVFHMLHVKSCEPPLELSMISVNWEHVSNFWRFCGSGLCWVIVIHPPQQDHQWFGKQARVGQSRNDHHFSTSDIYFGAIIFCIPPECSNHLNDDLFKCFVSAAMFSPSLGELIFGAKLGFLSW